MQPRRGRLAGGDQSQKFIIAPFREGRLFNLRRRPILRSISRASFIEKSLQTPSNRTPRRVRVIRQVR